MRSSREDALNMMKGLKEESKLVRLVANIGDFEISIDGKVSDVSDRLEVRCTGARAAIPLPDTTKFEYFEPRDFPPGFEEHAFVSYWRVTDVAGSCVIAEFG